MEKCNQHDKEIKEIKTEFVQMKKDVYTKLDELFDEVRKPFLTEKEKTTLIISIIVYLVFSINYISGNNFRSIKNEISIDKVIEKNDKMYDILVSIKEDVAEIKGKNNK